MLKDEGVDLVVAGKFGPGAMAFLQQSKIDLIEGKVGTKVIDLLRSKILKYDAT